MENVITFTRFWYLIKRTTNSTGIRANLTVCYIRFCKTYTFFLLWTKTVPRRILLRYIEAIYIFILIKIIVQYLSVNSLKEFTSLEQYQDVQGFQRFHTGVKLSRMCGLSLPAIFTFWVFRLWHITLVLYSKRKRSITAPPPLTTKLISKPHGLEASETQRY